MIVRAQLLLLSVALSACNSGSSSPEKQNENSDIPAKSAVATTEANAMVSAWQSDLQFLAKELPKRHINLFHTLSKADFERSVAELNAKAPTLSSEQFLVELTRLVASIGEAHTMLHRFLWYLQLDLYLFSDGIYVLNAPLGSEWVIGQKLTHVGGVPIDTVVETLSKLISADNQAWRNSAITNLLVDATLLDGLGFGDRWGITTYTVVSEDGKSRVLSITLGQQVQMAPPTKLPLYRQHNKKHYWSTLEETSKLLYVQYNRCAEDPDYPFEKFSDDVLKMVDSNTVRRIIIDLRHNGGGNSAIMKPLIDGLKERHQKSPIKIYIAQGRRTASSAMLNSIEMKRRLGATWIGEDIGGNPNSYGDVKRIVLPQTGFKIIYSTKYFTTPGMDEDTIKPDIPVRLSYQQYKEGIDPVMQYVRSH